jgi:hypothetical protein
VVGGGLILAGLALGIGMFVWTLRGFMQTDATVPADGRAHSISVGTDRDRVLWVRPLDPADCTIVDLATGREVTFTGVAGTFTRSHGSGEWRAGEQFDPGSGELSVRCARSGGPAEIGPAPKIGSFVAGILLTILVPVVLGLLGLVVLIVTGVRFASGGPRTGQEPGRTNPVS